MGKVSNCSSCDYSLASAMNQFGSHKVKLRRVHDAAGCLSEGQSNALESRFDHLEKRFPQLNFALYIGELKKSVSLSELGFWLLNQARINGDLSIDNDSTVLLILDLASNRTGISLGYFSEKLLSAEDCNSALEEGLHAFHLGNHGKGALQVLRCVEKYLVGNARRIKPLKMSANPFHLFNKQESNLSSGSMLIEH